MIYPSQTKIMEGRTNISECVFEALFNVSWPKSGTHTLEKFFETNEDLERRKYSAKTLYLPKDEFRWLNETFDESFRSTFQRLVAQIEYSHP